MYMSITLFYYDRDDLAPIVIRLFQLPCIRAELDRHADAVCKMTSGSSLTVVPLQSPD